MAGERLPVVLPSPAPKFARLLFLLDLPIPVAQTVRCLPNSYSHHAAKERTMRERVRGGVVLGVGTVVALLAARGFADEALKEHSAIKPAMKDRARHDKFVQIAKRGGVDVLFLGDSITDAWGGEGHGRGAGAKIFEEEFVPLKAANFGIG